jgi:hypothetical protein
MPWIIKNILSHADQNLKTLSRNLPDQMKKGVGRKATANLWTPSQHRYQRTGKEILQHSIQKIMIQIEVSELIPYGYLSPTFTAAPSYQVISLVALQEGSLQCFVKVFRGQVEPKTLVIIRKRGETIGKGTFAQEVK